MKNTKKKLILILIVVILAFTIGLITMFAQNKPVGKIAEAEEGERKAAVITGTSDSRFTYEVNIYEDETTIMLVKYVGTDTDVIIPSTIDGYTSN